MCKTGYFLLSIFIIMKKKSCLSLDLHFFLNELAPWDKEGIVKLITVDEYGMTTE
jgi:hypothetical protein